MRKKLKERKQVIYFFLSPKKTDGSYELIDYIGGKGAGLAQMLRFGLPVPPGFTISSLQCKEFYENGQKISKKLKQEVISAIRILEHETGKKFGDKNNPLLVSVRSGSKYSMPGMMDTILNIGLNDKTVEGLAKLSNNKRFALDTYRRLLQMFGSIVLGIERDNFEGELQEILRKRNSVLTTLRGNLAVVGETEPKENEFKKEGKVEIQLDDSALLELIDKYKKIILKNSGKEFPQDVFSQLFIAIEAVFKSWNGERARIYRKLNNIPDDIGTAVNIQTMVFGNFGENSGTGVGFTRNPSTGTKELFGEYLPNAQGEDVVGGFRTPKPLTLLQDEDEEIYKQLVKSVTLLEKHFKDMQDFEFTVERGKLYLLQTRNGKRTGVAALNIGLQLIKERVIKEKEISRRIEYQHIPQLLADGFDTEMLKNATLLTKGLNASNGAATGKIVFDPKKAVELAKQGEEIILVRPETNPDDVHAMSLAKGILTQRGGLTSHAAVVSRHMGKPAVVGCESISFDFDKNAIKINSTLLKEFDHISIDGTTGNVYLGVIKTVPSKILSIVKGIEPESAGGELYKNFLKLIKILKKHKTINVRMNADTVVDTTIGMKFGASGIGLCRTEHMFFQKDRIPYVQKMIVARNKNELNDALEKIFEFQKEDFKAIFKTLKGLPVTIRTLDPPLHEFLPEAGSLEKQLEELNTKGNTSELEFLKLLLEKSKLMKEFNPMLGHRGCRLGITHPEITVVQVKAMIEAAYETLKEGIKVNLEIMIPLVNDVNELLNQKKIIWEVFESIRRKERGKLNLKIGTMIETPRALFLSEELAKEVDFFSFGTNDLTQMFFGFSRDDTYSIIEKYREMGIYKFDPFETIDNNILGKLIIEAVKKAKAVNPKLKIGICGEHGGEPKSIAFFKQAGFDYVSCSPFRVPVALLTSNKIQFENLTVKD